MQGPPLAALHTASIRCLTCAEAGPPPEMQGPEVRVNVPSLELEAPRSQGLLCRISNHPQVLIPSASDLQARLRST